MRNEFYLLKIWITTAVLSPFIVALFDAPALFSEDFILMIPLVILLGFLSLIPVMIVLSVVSHYLVKSNWSEILKRFVLAVVAASLLAFSVWMITEPGNRIFSTVSAVWAYAGVMVSGIFFWEFRSSPIPENVAE